MARYKRLCDRDVRTDDRYLFLETVMSAGDRLHLSYIGLGVSDGKPRNPAAPLAELKAVLDAADAVHEWSREPATSRPWLVRHPLQPFDARYFGQDPRLFTYSQTDAALDGPCDALEVQPFFRPHTERDAPLPLEAELGEFHSFFGDPAQHVLGKQMKIGLDALDRDRLPSDEPLAAGFPAIETVERKLFLSLLGPDADPHLAEPPDWLRLTGLLPPGRLGEATWTSTRALLDEMLGMLANRSGHPTAALAPADAHIDYVIAGLRIRGTVAHAFSPGSDPKADLVLVRPRPVKGETTKESSLGFKHLVPMFLDWALLRLQDSGTDQACRRIRPMLLAKEPSWSERIDAWDHAFVGAVPPERTAMHAELTERVERLVTLWGQGCAGKAWYFAKTSWALASEWTDDTPPVVEDIWLGDSHAPGERSYPPGYNAVLGGGVDFEVGGSDYIALRDYARALLSCIDLRPAVEAAV